MPKPFVPAQGTAQCVRDFHGIASGMRPTPSIPGTDNAFDYCQNERGNARPSPVVEAFRMLRNVANRQLHIYPPGFHGAYCKKDWLCAPSSCRGVTLVEAVLFISVILGLIVGGLGLYQQAARASAWQDVRRGVETINSELRAMYQVSNWYKIIGNLNGSAQEFQDVLIAMQTVPDRYLSEDRSKIVLGPIGELKVRQTQPSSGVYEVWFYFIDTPDWLCSRLITANESKGGKLAAGIIPNVYEVYAFRQGVSRIHNIGRSGDLTLSLSTDLCQTIASGGTVKNIVIKSRLAL